MTIKTLPDDSLLEIFDIYLNEVEDDVGDKWHMLVHVCRRWRNVVFSSPRRLNLLLLCLPGRSVRKMLDIWPVLPISISDHCGLTVENAADIIDALKLNDRVSRIDFLDVSSFSSSPVWGGLAAVMQVPFLALRDLSLWSHNKVAPVISDSFLGGSAPHLRTLSLKDIAFPALPKLLLSATHLVELWLWNIPHSGYISPEAMVTCLSALTRLELLSLRFRSPLSRPDRASRNLLPYARTIFPILSRLEFEGVTQYLEELVARIDIPFLQYIAVTFFNQFLFDILQLPNLVCRAEHFPVLSQADLIFRSHRINVEVSQKRGTVGRKRLEIDIRCKMLDWQLSSLAQVCNSFPTLSTLERLYIREDPYSPPHWQDDMENNQWLELLYPFTHVKDLHLSKEVAHRVGPALQELTGERVTEVLPALENLFLDEIQPPRPAQEAIEQFVVMRELSGHPVAIHGWDREE